MGITESIIEIIIIIVACIIWIYKIGISEGRHREKMHIMNIITKMSIEKMTPEARLHALYVVNYMVMKLREE